MRWSQIQKLDTWKSDVSGSDFHGVNSSSFSLLRKIKPILVVLKFILPLKAKEFSKSMNGKLFFLVSTFEIWWHGLVFIRLLQRIAQTHQVCSCVGRWMSGPDSLLWLADSSHILLVHNYILGTCIYSVSNSLSVIKFIQYN